MKATSASTAGPTTIQHTPLVAQLSTTSVNEAAPTEANETLQRLHLLPFATSDKTVAAIRGLTAKNFADIARRIEIIQHTIKDLSSDIDGSGGDRSELSALQADLTSALAANERLADRMDAATHTHAAMRGNIEDLVGTQGRMTIAFSEVSATVPRVQLLEDEVRTLKNVVRALKDSLDMYELRHQVHDLRGGDSPRKRAHDEAHPPPRAIPPPGEASVASWAGPAHPAALLAPGSSAIGPATPPRTQPMPAFASSSSSAAFPMSFGTTFPAAAPGAAGPPYVAAAPGPAPPSPATRFTTRVARENVGVRFSIPDLWVPLADRDILHGLISTVGAHTTIRVTEASFGNVIRTEGRNEVLVWLASTNTLPATTLADVIIDRFAGPRQANTLTALRHNPKGKGRAGQ